MIRSRTVRLAAIAVLGSAVLAGTTGCGGTREAGAAVVVGGDRVTDRQIQDKNAELQKYQAANANNLAMIRQAFMAAGAPSAGGDPSREQVSEIVDGALWAKAAQLDGVTVTAADDAAELQVIETNIGQTFQNLQIQLPSTISPGDALLWYAHGVGQEIVPSRVPSFVHMLATRDTIAKAEAAKLKVDASTQNQPGPLNTALADLLAKAQSQIGLKVSPRYASGVDLQRQALGMELASSTPAWVRPGTDQQASVPAAPQGQPQQR